MPLVSTTIPNLVGGVSQQPYTIRMASQCEAMENCLPTVVEFLCRRPATRHIAKIMDNKVDQAAIHIINRDAAEQYVLILTGSDLRIFDLDGREMPVNFEADKKYILMDRPNVDADLLTINDYTFVLNKNITVRMTGELSKVRQPEALVFIKQASYATDYRITLNGTTVTHTTFKDDNRNTAGTEYTSKNGFNMDDTASLDANRYKLSSSVVAADLAAKVAALGPYAVQNVKSTLWIRRTNGGEFTASISDSRSNTQMSITTNKVQRFSDLPVVAPNGYTTEVIGDQSSSFDNYYVRFETNDGTAYDDGVWKETVKPGIPVALDAATMPHALVRGEDGAFRFKTLDWGKRTCGDEDSAPDPSFVGRKLNAVYLYHNRLGVLAQENAVFSEAGQFFNYFVTTVTTMVDSDPIDIAASHTTAADLYHPAPFSEGMLLFSDKTQFILEHDDNMSGKTTNVKPLTSYECSIEAKPIGLGKTIFFATQRGSWAGVREYFLEKEATLMDAPDITSHVPHYIPAHIHKLIGSTNEDCLLALSSQDRHVVSLYKYYWNDTEKLQSSWSKWIFSGEVLSAGFLNSTLILIMQYDDGVYLEALNIEPGYADLGATFEFRCDRKISEKTVTGITYDSDTEQSTLTLPYAVSGKPIVVSRYPSNNEEASNTPPGVVFEVVSWDGNTVIAEGDLRETLFFVGIPYTSRFEFSKQIVRENSGNSGKLAVTEGRLQLRNFTLTYGDTGYFEVWATPEYRPTDKRRFTGRILGHGSNILGLSVLPSDTYRFPVLSKADTVKIEIISDSFLPFQITSAGWEGFYHVRSGRI